MVSSRVTAKEEAQSIPERDYFELLTETGGGGVVHRVVEAFFRVCFCEGGGPHQICFEVGLFLGGRRF